jgi:hypothetical protein
MSARAGLLATAAAKTARAAKDLAKAADRINETSKNDDFSE